MARTPWTAHELSYESLPPRRSRLIPDQWPPGVVITVLCGTVLYIAAASYLVYQTTDDPSGALLLGIIGFLVAVGIGYIINSFTDRISESLREFASKNSFHFLKLGDIKDIDYRGVLRGRDQSFTTIVSSSERHPRFHIFTYQFETGTTNSTSKVWRYSVIDVILPRSVPHIICDNRRNNFLGASTLSHEPDSAQKVSLEGDFSHYFDVYVLNDYSRDGLSILTPDVMSALIDLGDGYDFEFADNHVYAYRQGRLDDSRAAVRNMMEIIEVVQRECGKQSQHYQVLPNLSGSVLPNKAIQGHRLLSGISWDIWVYIGLVFYLLLLQPLLASLVLTIAPDKGHALAIIQAVGILFATFSLILLIRRVLR